MFSKIMMRGLLAAAFFATAPSAQADLYNMGGGQTSLQFVTVGNPGNAADPATGNLYGSVGYTYQIGTYDVTVAQYCQFLNAVATQSDPYGLSSMATDQPTVHITRSGSPGSYSYAARAVTPKASTARFSTFPGAMRPASATGYKTASRPVARRPPGRLRRGPTR